MTDSFDSPLGRSLSGFFADRSGLAGNKKELFKEIIQRLVQASRDGHTCVDVSTEQAEILTSSRLVSKNADLPLVLRDLKLYLARYFLYEKKLAETLLRLTAISYSPANIEQKLDLVFPEPSGETDWQREAARIALSRGLCIISGGPGTGKTTTIVKIVTLLLICYGPDMKIALAAPTGKAAMRMRESISSQVDQLIVTDELKASVPREVMTLHRLLGARRFSPRFRHNNNNPMVWDAVIVDEASMVDLAMMSKLTQSLKQEARLILIGDKDQLASVESGSVLADCIEVLENNVVELQKSYRFDSSLSEIACMVNRGEGDGVVEMLKDDTIPDVMMATSSWEQDAGSRYISFMDKAIHLRQKTDLPELFRMFNEFRILCAVRYGSRGVIGLNGLIERYLAREGFGCGREQWYPGRPVIINRNDYSLGLFNGDVGFFLPYIDDRSGAVWFEQTDGTFRGYSPSRLVSCETVWAMTVHKSQGSEFGEVLVVFPGEDNPVLCRELLYTGITRARRKVSIQADVELLKKTINKRMRRFSGLADQLQKRPPELIRQLKD